MTAHTTTLPALRLRFVRHSDRIEIWFGEEYRNLYKVKYKHIYRARARHQRTTTGKHGARRPR